MTRLRTAHPAEDPGIRRRRRGRGWSFVHDDGRKVSAADRERARDLVLPPAWTDVWIAADPRAHIQAIGTDDAGRVQYRYHPEWSDRRARLKHERALDLAERMPALRGRVTRDLALDGLPPERVLAAALRLLDAVAIRAGGDAYAEERGSRGLMTLLVRHAHVEGDRIALRFPAKSGQRFEIDLEDAPLARCLEDLRMRRSGASRLFAWRDERGAHTLHAHDLNDAVREATGGEFTAKDFRTLHGTIVAALSLARARETATQKQRAAAEREAVRATAEALGNTVAVARSSYIDPEVFERFRAGATMDVRGSHEKALLALLR